MALDSADAPLEVVPQSDVGGKSASSIPPKKLPEANEFTPGQLDVRKLLSTVGATPGDREAVIEAVRKTFFADAAQQQSDPEKRKKQQRTRAYNALLGASKYGLVEPGLTELTELGSALLATKADDEMYRLLARHIVRDLHGIDVLLAVKEMQEAGDPVTKTTLQDFLMNRSGFTTLPRGTTHHTKLLQFLREASMLPPKGYEIDEEAVESISGLSLTAADAWAGLTDDQRAFLRVLRKRALIDGDKDVPAKAVTDATVFEYGPIFKQPDQLAATVFKPLAEAGWLVHKVGKAGRGGKSGTVAASSKLLATEVDLLPEDKDGWGIPPDLRSKLQTPMSEIQADLGSDDTHTKGIALELLAVRLAVDLTLSPIRLRERGIKTGGAEVDLIAEAAHLHFSRWLVQCKNTKTVRVEALAKEIGMAVLLRAHVVVIVTTGSFSPAVDTYARELATTTALQVVLVDATVLASYRKLGSSALRKFFNERARQTLTIKRPQVVSEADG